MKIYKTIKEGVKYAVIGAGLAAIALAGCNKKAGKLEEKLVPELTALGNANSEAERIEPISEGLPKDIAVLADYLAKLAVSKGTPRQVYSLNGHVPEYELDIKSPNSNRWAVIRFTDMDSSGRFELGDTLMVGTYEPGNLCARAGTGVEISGGSGGIVSRGVLDSGLQWRRVDNVNIALSYLKAAEKIVAAGKEIRYDDLNLGETK